MTFNEVYSSTERSLEERSSEEPLMHKEGIEAENLEWRWTDELRHTKSRRNLTSWATVLLPWLLLTLLGTWNLVQYQRQRAISKVNPSQRIYSPAQDVLEYELRTFYTGHDDGSPYVGEPSDELDEAWLGLYPSLFQLIPQAQAAQLYNGTALFPHDPERRYIIELDVFHQLHCLNMIRQSLRPDYYEPSVPQIINGHEEDGLYGPRHTSHCIEIIRQGITCAGDITPYTWIWDEKEQQLRNRIDTPHTCRNFDKIREWASPENYGGDFANFDLSSGFRELNDPLDPLTWVNGYSG